MVYYKLIIFRGEIQTRVMCIMQVRVPRIDLRPFYEKTAGGCLARKGSPSDERATYTLCTHASESGPPSARDPDEATSVNIERPQTWRNNVVLVTSNPSAHLIRPIAWCVRTPRTHSLTVFVLMWIILRGLYLVSFRSRV